MINITKGKTYNFVIIGAGAIGKLMASFLCQISQLTESNINVYLLARDKKYQQIKNFGLHLKIGPLTLNYSNLHIIRDLSEIQTNVNVILILAVKAYHLSIVLESMKNYYAPNQPAAIILPINGLGIEECVRNYYFCPLITCAITLPINIMANCPNFAEITNFNGGFAFAPYRNAPINTQLLDDIASMFRRACDNINNMLAKNGIKFNLKKAKKRGLEVFTPNSSNNVRWNKLVLNIIANITCAILQMTPEQVYTNKIALMIEWLILKEVFTIMSARGYKLIDLPGYPAKDLEMLRSLVTDGGVPYFIRFWLFQKVFAAKIIKARQGKDPSFLRDRKAGIPTEARWYHTAIDQAAQEAGSQAPINRKLAEIMDGITDGTYGPDNFTNRPSLLMQTILDLPT